MESSGVVCGSPKARRASKTPSTGSRAEGKGSRGPRLGPKQKKPSIEKRRPSAKPNCLRRRKGAGDESIFDWKSYDKKFWQEYWLRFTGVASVNTRMPLSGGTRMLRARRKDINVKPNRRLDRKSSKGMLFENEELRMRTIAINSEVEQGQHALKKLRRENELLRREVWSLRDEYSKMENLLQRKGSDEEDEQTDQEDSYTEGESDEYDLEEEEDTIDGNNPENPPALEQTANQTAWLSPRRTSKTFDGLSVIDELTEETQTTDGHGNSRGSSIIRPDKLPEPMKRIDPGYYAMYNPMDGQIFKTRKSLENMELTEWGSYRPSSPYPYGKSAPIPPYDHRLQCIQEPNIPVEGSNAACPWLCVPPGLSNALSTSNPSLRVPLHLENSSSLPKSSSLPYQRAEMNKWIHPLDVSPYLPYPPPLDDVSKYPRDSEMSEGSLPPPPPPEVDDPDNSLGLVEERHGPDVFITDAYAYLPPPPDDLISIASQVNKLEISQNAENRPKYTAGTHGASAIVEDAASANSARGIGAAQAPRASKSAAGGASAHNMLVGCQFPSTEDLRQNADDAEMSREKKPFQSKLTLTLRFPEGRKSPSRQTGQAASNGKSGRAVSKHELPRLQTFGAGSRTTAATPAAGSSTGTPGAGVTPTVNPPTHRVPVEDIPVPATTANPRAMGSSTSLDGLTSGCKPTTLGPGGQGGQERGKVAPQPPPRTSSCPSVSSPAAIPTPPIGVTALHHRTFRKGKSGSGLSSHPESDKEVFAADSAPQTLTQTNPLLLGEPAATSSPTLQSKFHSQKSVDSQRPRLRKQNSVRSTTQDETTDEGIVSGSSGLIRKSSKTSKAETERTGSRKARKQSQVSLTSLDNALINPLDRTRLIGLNNISISSSSGLDSPTKSDRRKRRVSIKFNKKTGGASQDEERPGILTNFRSKSRCDETDGTNSDRERTNSVSSRTSSLTRRKLSSSSSRTIFHEEKIPWCGCWGNGCV